MTPAHAEPTCGMPDCTGRAVFASCTAEQTVVLCRVLCRRHRDRMLDLQAEARADEDDLAPRMAASVGGSRW